MCGNGTVRNLFIVEVINMIGTIGLIGLVVAFIVIIVKYNQLKTSGDIWYIVYSVGGIVLLILLAAPLGVVGMLILGVIFLNRSEAKEKIRAKLLAKFTEFLKKHRLPPYHKDDVKVSDPKKPE